MNIRLYCIQYEYFENVGPGVRTPLKRSCGYAAEDYILYYSATFFFHENAVHLIFTKMGRDLNVIIRYN